MLENSLMQKTCRLTGFFFSDRVGIQTPNLLIRSEMLYSVELHSHDFIYVFSTYT
jgi:hypothetical protein